MLVKCRPWKIMSGLEVTEVTLGHFTCFTLTQTVVSIMRQAEAIVARAPVVSRDVDALMDTTTVVLSHTFVYICRQKAQQNLRVGSQQLFETQTQQRNTFIFFLGEKKKKININVKQSLGAKLSVRL